MKNSEILMIEAAKKGFIYNEENLFTVPQWNNRGYKVKKGEKAFIRCLLWKNSTKIDENGNEVSKTFMTMSYLFTSDQVEKMTQKEIEYRNKKKSNKNKVFREIK